MSLEKIEFFGVADRKGKRANGKVTSEYPAWYFDQHIAALQREIDYNENVIKNHYVPENVIPETRAELAMLKNRMQQIRESKPRLTGKDTDSLNRLYDSLAIQIGDSMYSRTEMKKGLANVHEEVRRMTAPIINADPEFAPVFDNLGVKPVNGKLSRNQAAKIVKICGKLLDKPTNVEYFRKDYNHGTYHSERSLAELEME